MQHVMSDRPTWYMNKHEAGIDVNLHTKDINMDLNKQMNVNLSAGFVAAIAKKHQKWSQARSCWVRPLIHRHPRVGGYEALLNDTRVSKLPEHLSYDYQELLNESEMEELVPEWGWWRDKSSWFQRHGEA